MKYKVLFVEMPNVVVRSIWPHMTAVVLSTLDGLSLLTVADLGPTLIHQ